MRTTTRRTVDGIWDTEDIQKYLSTDQADTQFPGRIGSNSAHRQPPTPQKVLTGKGGAESGEESKPGQVKGTHVRLGNAEDFEDRSLILGVHGQLEASSPVINGGGIEITDRLPANIAIRTNLEKQWQHAILYFIGNLYLPHPYSDHR